MIKTKGEKAFLFVSHLFLTITTLCVIVPFILLFMSSITDENELIAHGYSFWPGKFSLEALLWVGIVTKLFQQRFLCA